VVSGRSLAFWLLRIGLAGVYIFAAVPKILDPWAFAKAIHNFKILPLEAIPALAIWLPALEALAALAVLTGIFYRGGLVWLTALSLAFAAGIVSAILRKLDIDCGCFGTLARSSASWPHLVLNLATAAAGIFLIAVRARTPRRRRLLR
jgi:uncharacterized membrane protein YphA (DoxX/SURF4 family)